MKLGAFVLLMSMLGADLEGTTVGKGKVYVGPDGLEVSVLPFNKSFMIAVTGSGSVFDGKVVSHALMTDGDRSSYAMPFHGRKWNTLTVRGNAVSLYVPGHRDGISLHYDPAKTAAFKPEPMLALLKEQHGGFLFPYDRKAEIAEQEKQLQASTDEVRTACGFAPALQIDWDSISDEDIQQISISSYCGEPLETMARMCAESNEAKRTITDKVKTFACTMGKSAGFGVAGTKLTWITTRNATNIGELTRAYLAGPATAAGEAPPWGKGATLGERMTLEKTGRLHRRQEPLRGRRAAREAVDAALLRRRQDVLPGAAAALGADRATDFFEPRFFATTKNSNFRGLDMRHLRVGRLRRRQEDLLGELRPPNDAAHDAGRGGQEDAARQGGRPRRRCTSAPRIGSRATRPAATSTSTRGTRRRRRRAFASSSAPRGR